MGYMDNVSSKADSLSEMRRGERLQIFSRKCQVNVL